MPVRPKRPDPALSSAFAAPPPPDSGEKAASASVPPVWAQEGFKPAGGGVRLAAMALDTIFLSPPAILLAGWLSGSQASAPQVDPTDLALALSQDPAAADRLLHSLLPSWGEVAASPDAIELAVGLVLTVGAWRLFEATPGKALLGLRVVSSRTGAPLGLVRAFVRHLGYFVCAIPLGLGFLSVPLSKDKRGWHDKMAGSIVLSHPDGRRAGRPEGAPARPDGFFS